MMDLLVEMSLLMASNTTEFDRMDVAFEHVTGSVCLPVFTTAGVL